MCYTLIEQTADHSATRGTDGDTKARSVRVKIDIRDWAAGVAVHDGSPKASAVLHRYPPEAIRTRRRLAPKLRDLLSHFGFSLFEHI